MDDNICFNCRQENPGHLSKNCPVNQNFTRCHYCDSVCVRQESHKVWCKNSTFRSVCLKRNHTVQESTEVFSLFCSTQSMSIMDGNIRKLIGFHPMYLRNLNLILMKKDANTIACYSVTTERVNVHLSISDNNGNDRFCLKLFQRSFVINRSICV